MYGAAEIVKLAHGEDGRFVRSLSLFHTPKLSGSHIEISHLLAFPYHQHNVSRPLQVRPRTAIHRKELLEEHRREHFLCRNRKLDGSRRQNVHLGSHDWARREWEVHKALWLNQCGVPIVCCFLLVNL